MMRTGAGVATSSSWLFLPSPSVTASVIGELPGPVFCSAAMSRSAPAGNGTLPESKTTVFVPATVT